MLAACTSHAIQPTDVPTTETIETIDAPLAAPTSAPPATVEVTEPVTLTLNIWWPEPLAPIDNQDAADLLSEQISAFQAANRDISGRFSAEKSAGCRRDYVDAASAASLVAPRALPDLTLLRRSDMLSAAQAGLIMPLDEQAEAAILDNFQPMVGALGRMNDRLYGLPYNVEVQHMAYQTGSVSAGALEFCQHAGATRSPSSFRRGAPTA